MALLKTELPRFEEGDRLALRIEKLYGYLEQLQPALDYLLSHLSSRNLNGAGFSLGIRSADGTKELGTFGLVSGGVGLMSGSYGLRVSSDGVEFTTDSGDTWHGMEAADALGDAAYRGVADEPEDGGDGLLTAGGAYDAMTAVPFTATEVTAQGVTIGFLRAYRVGKLALVDLEFTLTGTLSDHTTIASGLPIPPDFWWTTAHSWNAAFKRPCRVQVSTSGNLRLRYGEAGTYDVLIVYPIA